MNFHLLFVVVECCRLLIFINRILVTVVTNFVVVFYSAVVGQLLKTIFCDHCQSTLVDYSLVTIVSQLLLTVF